MLTAVRRDGAASHHGILPQRRGHGWGGVRRSNVGFPEREGTLGFGDGGVGGVDAAEELADEALLVLELIGHGENLQPHDRRRHGLSEHLLRPEERKSNTVRRRGREGERKNIRRTREEEERGGHGKRRVEKKEKRKEEE